jgi:hypothetical protein
MEKGGPPLDFSDRPLSTGLAIWCKDGFRTSTSRSLERKRLSLDCSERPQSTGLTIWCKAGLLLSVEGSGGGGILASRRSSSFIGVAIFVVFVQDHSSINRGSQDSSLSVQLIEERSQRFIAKQYEGCMT